WKLYRCQVWPSWPVAVRGSSTLLVTPHLLAALLLQLIQQQTCLILSLADPLHSFVHRHERRTEFTKGVDHAGQGHPQFGVLLLKPLYALLGGVGAKV